MPRDPIKIQECRGWLSKATSDLAAAAKLARDEPSFLAQALFLCQQSAEKSLKGFLFWSGTSFRKTHNLEELGEACIRLDPSLSDLIKRIAGLTSYAWLYRYPGNEAEPTPEEFDIAWREAKDLLDAILQRLPIETHP
jgi:HEPN domain-containing protein